MKYRVVYTQTVIDSIDAQLAYLGNEGVSPETQAA